MPLVQYHQTQMALGSYVTLVIVTDKLSYVVDDIFRQLWLMIYRFERQFSRFLPASELSLFNEKAGVRMPISTEFQELLTTAKNLAEKTDGLYNPFILPALQRAGYSHSFVNKYNDDPQPDYTRHQVVNADHLTIEDGFAIIPYGTALDMGGCGKGFLADKLAAQPFVRELAGFWFSLGGDVVGGGRDKDSNSWVISIQDAKNPEERLQKAIPGSRSGFAIATSGTVIRKGTTIKGDTWHHLIDPATQRPVQTDIALATVCAPSAVEADVLASCAVIKGSQDAVPFLNSHSIKTALLQHAETSDITTIGKFMNANKGGMA